MKELLLRILMQIIYIASPEIRKEMCKALQAAKEKAKQTQNPWDDILIDVIITLLGC